MIHPLTALALLLHVLFWGAGLAMLTMPRPWRRFWPVLVVPAGLGLQSAVVWLGALANWPGTDAYGRWSLVLPAGLLGWALARRGWRHPATDLSRFGLVAAAVGGCLVLLVLPLIFVSPTLTTISLGSCDAADYAAGARVLQEFAGSDRTGFLGLTEVVRVHSVDNFFDYWIRLNHFTPSALIALNGAVLGRSPHEITTLVTAVLLAGTVPVVFWTARAVLGYSGGASLLVAALFGVSPIMWYAVAHAAPGQLLAAQAVAWLTWAGVALWRLRLTWRRGAQFVGVLLLADWLLLGSYNFFVVLCLVPAAAYAGGGALWTRAWSRLAQWTAVMVGPLVICAGVFWPRTAGLVERFTLLRTYDFGWKIPPLTAEGWLGMVQGPDLEPWAVFGVRWILSALVVGLLTWACLRAAQQRNRFLWAALALLLPVLAGYAFLQARGARLGTNASYDAYKLFAVFYPVLLPAFFWWVTLRRSRRLHEWLLVVGVAAGVGVANAVAGGMFLWKMSHSPLRVDAELAALQRVEAMSDVRSVNLLVPDMWSRLWANAFLLRKEQYFETHTYEGRRNTGLKGEWDLEGGITAVEPASGARRPLTARFTLVDTRARDHVRVSLAAGWQEEEFLPGGGERWRWTGADATFVIDNPHGEPRQFRCTLDARAHGERELVLQAREGAAAGPAVRVGLNRERLSFAPITVPAGRSEWVLHSREPARRAAPEDPRLIAVCVYRLTLTATGR